MSRITLFGYGPAGLGTMSTLGYGREAIGRGCVHVLDYEPVTTTTRSYEPVTTDTRDHAPVFTEIRSEVC